ncbi:hypothetical protein ABTZ58_23975 [Streptomyces sp. NPDC094143]|uniref:hypothetical protein n=1 Tax=Streptomyces sp. NPDC094143 TaxID=3155310 RepID=UPI00332F79B0
MKRKVPLRLPHLAVVAIAAVLCVAGTGTGHASEVYGTYGSQLECQTKGNQLAQQGKLTGFTCQYMGTLGGQPIWMLIIS